MLARLWNILSNLGIYEDLEAYKKLKVRLFNQLCMLHVLIFAVFLLENILLRLYADFIFNSLLIAFWIGLMYLNHRKKYQYPPYILSVVYPIVLTFCHIGWGNILNIRYVYIFSFITVIIFIQNTKVNILFITWIFLCVLFGELFVAKYGFLTNQENVWFAEYVVLVFVIFSCVFIVKSYVDSNREFVEKSDELLHEVQKNNTALELANRDLERFAYITSHDLKTPLRNVISFLGLLKDKVDKEDEEAQTYFKIAEDGARHMNKLIDDILNYSRLEKATLETELVDLNKVVEHILLHTKVKLGSKKVAFDIAKLPTILSNESLMKMLFQNLIENAIKYNESELPNIKIQATSHKKNLLLSFQDNGIGMDEQYQDRIFEMFARLHTHTAYEGTGIGLAVCKKIVDKHKGKIWFESKEGKGTTFYVELPNVIVNSFLEKLPYLDSNKSDSMSREDMLEIMKFTPDQKYKNVLRNRFN